MTHKVLLTKEGHQKLTQELANLKQKQEHLVIQIEEVAQPDESGQDGLAQQLKEELEVVLEKINKLETALSVATIINRKKLSKTEIQIGSRVKIKLSPQNEKEFEIVDKLEADPSLNKISHQSPIGQALMGKKINQTVDVSAPVGNITYKIISIS